MEELTARTLHCTRTSTLPAMMGENGERLGKDRSSGQPGIDMHMSRTGKQHVLVKQPLLGTPLSTHILSLTSDTSSTLSSVFLSHGECGFFHMKTFHVQQRHLPASSTPQEMGVLAPTPGPPGPAQAAGKQVAHQHVRYQVDE